MRFQFHYLRAFLTRILTRNLLRAMISRRVWLCESEYPLQYEATPTDLHLSLSPAVLLHTMPLYTVYNYFIPQYSCLSSSRSYPIPGLTISSGTFYCFALGSEHTDLFCLTGVSLLSSIKVKKKKKKKSVHIVSATHKIRLR